MNELFEKVIRAMELAGYYYDDINSSDNNILYNYEGQSFAMSFDSLEDNIEWLKGVVIEDMPEENEDEFYAIIQDLDNANLKEAFDVDPEIRADSEAKGLTSPEDKDNTPKVGKETHQDSVAGRIVDLLKDYDHYEFVDCYKDDEEAISDIQNAIENDKDAVIKTLRDIADDTKEYDEDIEKEARNLLDIISKEEPLNEDVNSNIRQEIKNSDLSNSDKFNCEYILEVAENKKIPVTFEKIKEALNKVKEYAKVEPNEVDDEIADDLRENFTDAVSDEVRQDSIEKGLTSESEELTEEDKVEYKKLNELKEQGNIFMLEADGKYIVGEDYNKEENTLNNANIYDNKEEADKDYLNRCGITKDGEPFTQE